MLENWCWNFDVMQRLSQHYETKAPLPAEDLKKVVAAKQVNVALFTCRQIHLAIMDMRIHTEAPADLQALDDELRPTFALTDTPPGME